MMVLMHYSENIDKKMHAHTEYRHSFLLNSFDPWAGSESQTTLSSVGQSHLVDLQS